MPKVVQELGRLAARFGAVDRVVGTDRLRCGSNVANVRESVSVVIRFNDRYLQNLNSLVGISVDRSFKVCVSRRTDMVVDQDM